MVKNMTITTDEIQLAQEKWGAGIVAIGKIFTDGGDYIEAAENHLDTLYAFEDGPVLFKPTKAGVEQFRLTKEGALSYFVGGNDKYQEDNGFALHPWIKVRFDNKGIYIHDGYAVAMENYYFTETSGNEVKVEYTFGYFKDQNGNLKINLHHSSIPFSAG
ncbi:phosphoribosyl-AMP cyclohydrolase [Desulfolithobacter dissulfuricans]|uniref:Phosphoribosyl-AMP cyclohydrolase n=1 Tax=Desulfolithobacter dissulfuricans TaxID=2795293 RepID=A0A915XJW0_9BACT|nr:hypothetical protein [Desulfolithobacter dissulfuricans]BCO08398.1 phosphoribosyl-AMP cyclohydrolase [Desulfolithobacter dissulfuricans]